MKRVILALALLLPVAASAQPTKDNLMGLGLTAELANEIGRGSVAWSTPIPLPVATVSAAATPATLPAVYNLVTAVATAGASVRLPAVAIGTEIWAKNAGLGALSVHPNSGAAINAAAAATPVSAAASGAHVIRCVYVATNLWACTDAASAS